MLQYSISPLSQILLTSLSPDGLNANPPPHACDHIGSFAPVHRGAPAARPGLESGARVGGALLLVVSCALMLAGLMSRSMQSRTVADRVAALGLLAMSLFSSLFVFTLLRDLVLLVAIVALPVRHVHLLSDGDRAAGGRIGAFVTVVGFAGARRRARIVSVEVPLANLPPALHGFSIAQISDVHVGSQIKRKYVDAIVDAVNGLDRRSHRGHG